MKIRLQTKKEQREIARARVSGLSDKDVLSRRIAERVLSLEEYRRAESVMVYMSLPNEVDTRLILEDALKSKKVFVPVTLDTLKLISIDKNTRFIKGAFGVSEPEKGEEAMDVDFAVIPMVAYDPYGNRLGHGKGYFDKFLTDKKCLKAGIAFSAQEFERLAVADYDVKMDIIVNENETLDLRGVKQKGRTYY
ncbi:MAG TPA: 5-formyltetrahydrofolate cyclo-ligase [Clostridia bacterium]|nr:5-formyltetrahydrofolate cyclo-ligase [Clostridia bacterium]